MIFIIICLLDYCDVYLTHDAPRVRRDHNAGWKHAAQVKAHFLCTSILMHRPFIILALNQDKMARQVGEIVKDYEARGGAEYALKFNSWCVTF